MTRDRDAAFQPDASLMARLVILACEPWRAAILRFK